MLSSKKKRPKLAKATLHLEELVHRFGDTPDRYEDDIDKDEPIHGNGHYFPPRAESAPAEDLYGA